MRPPSDNSRGRGRGAATFIAAVIPVALGMAACGGGKSSSATDSSATAPPAIATTAGGLPTPAPGAPPATATAAMLAEGDSIFHALKAGGLCQTCHGADANGTVLAPGLTDTVWLTGDGSYSFIQKRVTEGMPTPTPPYTAAMPPMGGAPLTPAELQSVSAYVYSLSHKSG